MKSLRYVFSFRIIGSFYKWDFLVIRWDLGSEILHYLGKVSRWFFILKIGEIKIDRSFSGYFFN